MYTQDALWRAAPTPWSLVVFQQPLSEIRVERNVNPIRLSTIASFFRPLRDFVLPPVCLICGAPLEAGQVRICPRCWRGMRTVSPDDPLFCAMRGRLTSGGAIAGVVAEFWFEREGSLQLLIHQLKYEQMTGLGIDLGKRLGLRILSSLDEKEFAGLVPVPLHKSKLRERGYNQAEFISEGISSVTGLSVIPSILRRTRYTQSQTAMNPAERKANVHGAFAIRQQSLPAVRGKSYILVDDVITTGATVAACASVLTEAGAADIVACAAALAA